MANNTAPSRKTLDRAFPRPAPLRAHVVLTALSVVVAIAAPAVLSSPVAAETLADRFSNSGGKDKKAPMVVEADRVAYDNKAQTVAAVGDAQIYYKGKVLEADRVVYYRATGRVLAQGSVKLTEPDGTVTHADKMELTGDFKQGFVDSTRADTSERTHMSATRSEKLDADTTVFEKGVFTACPSCAEHPERAPLWRLRAEKIIHKNAEQKLYYESAWFELYGYPIAYFPFLSTSDPSVTRESGFLIPHVTYRSTTGVGIGLPYFWAIAPNMDVTLTPTYLSKQGAMGEIDFRHRLDNGYYQFSAYGVHQQENSIFPVEPFGAGNRTDRGIVESRGDIWLSQNWKLGWDVARVSDKWFLNDYALASPFSVGDNVFRETSSTVYLTGQGDRGYFDMRGFTFQGMANSDFQPQLATVAPIIDYNKRIALSPEKTYGIGGELEIDANFTHSSAAAASYQQTGSVQLDSAFGLYNVCRNPVTGVAQYSQQNCLLRGIGGDYSSATLQLTWQRKFIDSLGEVWTPFAFARGNGNYLSYDTSRTYTFSSTYGTSTIDNAGQKQFLSNNNDVGGYVTPGVGMEWRYPLLSKTPIGDMVIEPIGQVIARPNGQNANSMVNLDSQSLVFDDSNLFEWNKYSGYDRFETGVRANYGAQFTLDMKDKGYVNAMFGQSAQLAGANAYATPDAANIGLSSGLDTKMSDYVARVTYSPSSAYTFVAKARFDQATWEMRRLDLAATAHYGPLSGGVQFADYSAQPIIGYNERREGLQFNTRYDITPNYFTSGFINFDLSRHYYDAFLQVAAPVYSIAAWGLTGGYQDDCTKFTLAYSDAISDNYGVPAAYVRNRSLVLSLELRTLGELKAPVALSPSRVQDGARYAVTPN